MSIKIKNLTKEFKKNIVINIPEFEFKNNRIYGMYGRNGSGKTILLKLICGYYVPTTGEILINNINYNKQNEFPKDTRASIGEPNFYDDLNAFDNLEILSKIQNKIKKEEIEKALRIVNLNENNKKFKDFSLGMKQKLSIAQAIMEKPKILLLDEPFNGIERESIENIINYLKEYKSSETIIIVSSHIKEDLKKLCDEIIYIDSGKIYERDSIN